MLYSRLWARASGSQAPIRNLAVRRSELRRLALVSERASSLRDQHSKYQQHGPMVKMKTQECISSSSRNTTMLYLFQVSVPPRAEAPSITKMSLSSSSSSVDLSPPSRFSVLLSRTSCTSVLNLRSSTQTKLKLRKSCQVALRFGGGVR